MGERIIGLEIQIPDLTLDPQSWNLQKRGSFNTFSGQV